MDDTRASAQCPAELVAAPSAMATLMSDARLLRFMTTADKLADAALRAIEEKDSAALAKQSAQHIYVLAEIERMRLRSDIRLDIPRIIVR